MIKVIFGERKKDSIHMIFKRLDFTSIWKELIKNIEGEA